MKPAGKRNLRQMLELALVSTAAVDFRAKEFSEAPVFRRASVAFDNGVGLTIVGLDARDAEVALDACYSEIRRLERVAGLSTSGRAKDFKEEISSERLIS